MGSIEWETINLFPSEGRGRRSLLASLRLDERRAPTLQTIDRTNRTVRVSDDLTSLLSSTILTDRILVLTRRPLNTHEPRAHTQYNLIDQRRRPNAMHPPRHQPLMIDPEPPLLLVQLRHILERVVVRGDDYRPVGCVGVAEVDEAGSEEGDAADEEGDW